MAITRFDGTTSGSDSGWAARFYFENCLADGTAFRIEIIDSESAAGTFSQSETAVEWLDLEAPAFLLEYEGSADHRHEPLVPSSCTISMVQVDNAQGELMDAIHTNRDHRFGIALFLFEPDNTTDAAGETAFANGSGFWRPFWFGTIMADQGEAEHLVSKRKFAITAQCGLVLLNDEPFRSNSDEAFTDEKSLAVQIARCLDKIPTSTLWGYNQYNGATAPSASGLDEDNVNRDALTDVPAAPFFRESVWIQDKEKHIPTVASVDVPGGASVLDHTFCQSAAFVDIEMGEDAMGGNVRTRTYTSCGEVLEQIASVFGAQIFLSQGSWWFTNPECHLAEVDTNIYHRQHVWFTKARMLTEDSHGPLTGPIDTAALDIFARGYSLGEKVKQNVLFPVKGVSSKHIEGGTRRILGGGPEVGYNQLTGGMFGTRHDHGGQEFKAERTANQYELRSRTFTNEGTIIAGGQPLTISGRLSITRTGVRSTTLGNAYNTDKARGAKYKAEFKIKVGNYYLKRNITTRSETAPIKNSVGTTVRTAKFFEQSGDVEWTTAENTYDLVFPREGSNPEPATVELSSGGEVIDFSFLGGLHTVRRSENEPDEFKATEGSFLGIGTGTIQGSTEFSFDWTLPELPEGEDHTGVEINIDFKLLDSENNVISGTDSNQFFEHTDTQAVGTELTFARLFALDIVMGDGDEGGDVEFVAEVDNNTTKIVTCESVLGDFYEETAANRGMRVQNEDDDTFANSGERWVVGDNITADGKYIHKLRAAEVVAKRDKPVIIRSAELQFTDRDEIANPLSNERHQVSTVNFPVLHFGRPVKLGYTNGVNEWFHLLELKIQPEGYEFVMCKLGTGRTLDSITEADDHDNIVRGPRPSNTIVSDVPISRNPPNPATINTITRDVQRNVQSVDAVTAKTDFITITGAVDLDTVSAKVVPLTLNAGGTAFTAVVIEQDAIRADKLKTSTDHQLITQTQLNAISSNTLTTASHTDSIADIEDKTDLISVTAQTDLDAVRDDTATNTTSISTNATGISSNQTAITQVAGVSSTNATNIATNTTNIATNTTGVATNAAGVTGNANSISGVSAVAATNAANISTLQSEMDDVENALDEANNGAANRTGQTGVEVATFNASGVLGSVSDGSAGQFLQTNGSGVLSFANAGGGWHGSGTLIKVLPTEWMGNDVGRAITQARIEDDTSNTLGVACNQASGSLFAFNEIPTGYKATHVQVYTDAAVSNGVEVFSYNQTTGATTSVGTGDTNSNIDITDVTSGATANLVIEVSPGSTDRLIFGADITITTT